MIEKFTHFPLSTRIASLLARTLARGGSSCSLIPQESRKFRDHQQVRFHMLYFYWMCSYRAPGHHAADKAPAAKRLGNGISK